MPQASPGDAPPRAQEIELKVRLRVQDVAPLRARLDRLAPAQAESVDNTYFDTPDRRLAQARAALRLRCLAQGGRRRWVQTFKNQDSEAPLSVRGEWETAAPRARLDLARLAQAPLQRLLDGAPAESLVAVFRTVFERTRWDLDLPAARIEAVIDLGQIRAGGRVEAICEAEFELRSGSPRALLELALALAGAGGGPGLSLVPYGDSKAARGYRLAGLDAPAPQWPPAGRPRSVDGALRQAVARDLENLLREVQALPGAAAPARAASVHAARVALRRMRAAWELSGARAPRALLAQLRDWADRLGAVRDWDVFNVQILPLLAQTPAVTADRRAAGWDAVQAAAAARGARAHARLERQLEAPAFAHFALHVLCWCLDADDAGGAARRQAPAPAHLRRRLRALVRNLAQFATMAPARQHRLRIRAKRLRDQLTLLQDVQTRRRRQRIAERLHRFQDAAGALQDVAMAQRVLARLTRAIGLRARAATWAQAQRARVMPKAQRYAAALLKAV